MGYVPMTPWLNLHERWLLRKVGMDAHRRAAMREALAADGQLAPGEIDVAGQLGGIDLAQARVVADLERWFDRLLASYDRPVSKVVYGHRRYKKWVVLAAALQQAGVSPAAYTEGRNRGLRTLAEFKSPSR